MSAASWLLGEKTPAKSVAKVRALGADKLAETIVNDALNGLIRDRDGGGIFGDADASKMHVPYAGWYWRDVDFFGEWGVTIADAGGQTVICENNKWGYEERSLTLDEREEFLRLVWVAHRKSRAGGVVADINTATDKALAKAGAFIRGLSAAKAGEQ